MKTVRDNCFDFLRFLFAFVVVIRHLIDITGVEPLQCLAPYFQTYISVTGFFVISGFLITQSYMRSTVKQYFVKRAKRLLPAYLLIVSVSAVGLSALSSLSLHDYFCSSGLWQYLGAQLTFLNFLHPCLPGVFESDVFDCSVNPALWTLKIEVAFYICVPLIVWLLGKTKRKWAVLAVIYVLSVCYRNGLHWYANLTDRHSFVVLARQLPGFLSYFSAGMLCYFYKDWFLAHKNRLILPALAVFLAERYFDVEWLMPLAFGVTVIWAAYSLPRLNNFAKAGDISYGIYIYHAPLIKTAYTLGLFSVMNAWAASAVIILTVVVLGLLSWHLLEKPILARK